LYTLSTPYIDVRKRVKPRRIAHVFHVDCRQAYRKESAGDGWKRMLAWFKKNGVA